MNPRPLARLRRPGLATAALVLGAGGLLLAPSPARAVTLGVPTIGADITFDKDASCSSSSPSTAVPGSFAADGVPVTVTASSSDTISKPGDSSTVSGSVTHTVSATAAGGVLKTVSIEDSFSASATLNSASSTCLAGATASSFTTFQFDLPTAKYLQVDSDVVEGEQVLNLFRSTVGGEPVFDTTLAAYSPHVLKSASYYVPAGSYTFLVSNQTYAFTLSATNTVTSRTGTGSVTLDFEDPGAATTAAEGEGGKYVDLAAGRSCATNSLAATWKSKAGKGKHARVKKATFYVDGAKASSVRKPKKKHVTTVAGLDPRKNLEVLVKLKLAKKGAGTVTLQRSYLPCT